MIRPNDTLPTRSRRRGDIGHLPPVSGLDRTGAPWLGTSRVVDRPARRRANRRSWKAGQAADRDAFVTSQLPDNDSAAG